MTANIRSITDSDFAACVGAGVVVVHFTATWCKPCAKALPEVAGLAVDLRRRKGFAGAVLVQADVDAAPHAAHRCDVRGVPCLVLLRDGVPVASKMGFYAREKLLGWVEAQMQGAA